MQWPHRISIPEEVALNVCQNLITDAVVSARRQTEAEIMGEHIMHCPFNSSAPVSSLPYVNAAAVLQPSARVAARAILAIKRCSMFACSQC
jgi:hypothetical protein